MSRFWNCSDRVFCSMNEHPTDRSGAQRARRVSVFMTDCDASDNTGLPPKMMSEHCYMGMCGGTHVENAPPCDHVPCKMLPVFGDAHTKSVIVVVCSGSGYMPHTTQTHPTKHEAPYFGNPLSHCAVASTFAGNTPTAECAKRYVYILEGYFLKKKKMLAHVF